MTCDYQFYKIMIELQQEFGIMELCPVICSELQKYKSELTQDDQDLIDDLTSLNFNRTYNHLHGDYRTWLDSVMLSPTLITYIKKYILD